MQVRQHYDLKRPTFDKNTIKMKQNEVNRIKLRYKPKKI